MGQAEHCRLRRRSQLDHTGGTFRRRPGRRTSASLAAGTRTVRPRDPTERHRGFRSTRTIPGSERAPRRGTGRSRRRASRRPRDRSTSRHARSQAARRPDAVGIPHPCRRELHLSAGGRRRLGNPRPAARLTACRQDRARASHDRQRSAGADLERRRFFGVADRGWRVRPISFSRTSAVRPRGWVSAAGRPAAGKRSDADR